jgi:photosynthetic reaction center H subunit
MPTGAITGYIDVAQLVLYAFWIFFAALVFYLRREDKREGYPLVSEPSAWTRTRVRIQGFPPVPSPKTFLLPHGGTYTAPPGNPDQREIRAEPFDRGFGMPLEPTGDPMLDGVGPAAYAERADEPELTLDGLPLIAPLRVATDSYIEPRDTDPRGMPVLGADGQIAGTVRECWVDRVEPQIRYLEVELAGAAGGRHVLLPMPFARVSRWQRKVKVRSILARQFANVPGIRNPDVVTKLEEDRISAYYAGGTLYATPDRLRPVL